MLFVKHALEGCCAPRYGLSDVSLVSFHYESFRAALTGLLVDISKAAFYPAAGKGSGGFIKGGERQGALSHWTRGEGAFLSPSAALSFARPSRPLDGIKKPPFRTACGHLNCFRQCASISTGSRMIFARIKTISFILHLLAQSWLRMVFRIFRAISRSFSLFVRERPNSSAISSNPSESS